MKEQKGISLISLLLVVIIVIICILVFKNIFNKNNIENTNINNNSSTSINNKKDSKIVGSWKNGNFIYTFNEDGTANLSGTGINTQEFTYKIKNNKITLTNIETNGTLEQEYSIKDDQLYIGNVIYTKVK